MDFGATGKLGGYYLAEQYWKNAAGKSDGVSFAELAAAKAAGQSDVPGMSFKDMWQSRFSGAYYNVMDTSKIDGSLWGRNDYPWDKYFNNNVDDSVLDWKPSGAEPAMSDPKVQAKISSTLGKKAIVVPPALEEKMKNDPELAQKVMKKVESFIAEQEARRGREAKHEEYERLAEESALKRKLLEQETDERYYQTSITKKAVSIAAYEAAGILK